MHRRLNAYFTALRRLGSRRTTRTPAERIDAWLAAADLPSRDQVRA